MLIYCEWDILKDVEMSKSFLQLFVRISDGDGRRPKYRVIDQSNSEHESAYIYWKNFDTSGRSITIDESSSELKFIYFDPED
jgi:hypothetical protein